MLCRQVQSTKIFVEYGRISFKGTEYRNIKGVNISVLCTFGTIFYENSTNIEAGNVCYSVPLRNINSNLKSSQNEKNHLIPQFFINL
jgi:hypothetical protein